MSMARLVPKTRRQKQATAAVVAMLLCCCGSFTSVLSNKSSSDNRPAPPPARQVVPAVSLSPTVASSPSPTAVPTPVETTPPAPVETTDAPVPADPQPPADTGQDYVHGVHPGAFCSQHGAMGYSSDGTLMQCTTTATDSRYRWRRA